MQDEEVMSWSTRQAGLKCNQAVWFWLVLNISSLVSSSIKREPTEILPAVAEGQRGDMCE